MIAERYAGETESKFFSFKLSFVPCVNVVEDSSTTFVHEYHIGEPLLQLELVERALTNCTNSHFTLVNEQSEDLSQALSVYNETKFRQVNLTLEAASSETLRPGNYSIEVWEQDWFSGFIAKTIFEIGVVGPIK